MAEADLLRGCPSPIHLPMYYMNYMHVNIKQCMGVYIEAYTYIYFHMHILLYSQLSKTFSAKQYFTENFHFLLLQENENLKYKV